jgi:hypothetical protein
MPHGKLAGERCAHLLSDARCELFGKAERPAVCGTLQPSLTMCGDSAEQALAYLVRLEALTRPRREQSAEPVPMLVE